MTASSRPPEPPPMVCGVCNEPSGWWWDDEDQEWAVDSEWYKDPSGADRFICTRWCYLKAVEMSSPSVTTDETG